MVTLSTPMLASAPWPRLPAVVLPSPGPLLLLSLFHHPVNPVCPSSELPSAERSSARMGTVRLRRSILLPRVLAASRLPVRLPSTFLSSMARSSVLAYLAAVRSTMGLCCSPLGWRRSPPARRCRTSGLRSSPEARGPPPYGGCNPSTLLL